METELKLLVKQQAQQQLREHPLLKKYAASEPHVEHIRGTYFDTPDLALRQHNANLRVRHIDQAWVQTLKASERSAIGGLHQRHEWEARVSGPHPELASLRKLVGKKTPWARVLRSTSLERKLKPVFTTEVTRTVWELRLPGGDEIESALDLGRLECNGRHLPISEFELELKSGRPAHMLDFALTLQQDIPLRIGNVSKADRGYALVQPRPLLAVKALPLRLSPQMTPAQAFVAITTNCLAQIQANLEGALQGGDVESLHQLRIGLLRLRSAIKLFREQLSIPQALLQELRWLASQLSATRDWDVLAWTSLAALVRQVPAENSLLALRRAVHDKTHELHESLNALADAPRTTTLILGLTRLAQKESLLPLKDKPRRLHSFTRGLMARDHRRIQKRSRRLGGDQKASHRLRSAIKAARYDLEFLQALFKQSKSKPYLKALARLQEVLGRQHDALVADKLLQDFEKEAGDQTGSTGFARGYMRSQAASEEGAMRQVWKKFLKQKIPG
jgi:inorganic triphosphatase YgiF